MSTAREEILGRIRTALADVPVALRPPSVDDDVPREYGRGTLPDPGALAELLCERIRHYAAEAERVAHEHQIAEAVRAGCVRLGIERLLCAPGAPAGWRPDGITVAEDDGVSVAELDRVDGVLTGCALAIAETGTLVLDGRPPCGRRALTLVPDRHLCVVRAEQIVERVPEAIAALEQSVARARVPVTLVSGSSATSDIELERVEGVHGPRRLLVLIAG
ncbi:MAG TPA: LUD domain-containing protein [Solirubrobacteraceae bacterium]